MNNEIKIEGDKNINVQGNPNAHIYINSLASQGDQKRVPLPPIIATHNLTPPLYFTGREKVLNDIAEAFNSGRTASLCGISGLGKSSVACQFAKVHAGLYAHIVFIRVDRPGFEVNLDRSSESLGVILTPEDNEESKAAKFCRRIAEICRQLPENKRLLLIFDNVDEVERLQKFLPQHERLNILLTSNFERVRRLGREVEIGNLSKRKPGFCFTATPR
jgi:MoxR-like ATPase